MLSLYSAVILVVLMVSLVMCNWMPQSEDPSYVPRIAVMRRDGGDFDSLLSELKGKGSRMRFGKRSSKLTEQGVERGDGLTTGATNENEVRPPLNFYSPDRYVWLQRRR